MSTFAGHLNNRYERISMDRFDANNLNSTVFWLSHAHSDHMVGLRSTQFLEHLKSTPAITLYCTDVTKKLLSCMSFYSHLTEYMVALNIEEPTLVDIPLTDEESTDVVEQVTLTAIPAGHCPGSAMLLIEGNEGTVLYTGDFRFDVGTASMIQSLHDSYGKPKEIGTIHCDTTFLTQRILKLPSRSECEELIVKEVRDHISKGKNYHVLLRVKAKLGYENVYKIIYDTLGVKTHIQNRDGYLYSKIPSILETVTSNAETQVHSCCRYIITDDSSFRSSQPDTKCEVLERRGVITKVVHLSTLWFVHHMNKEKTIKTAADTVRCCYSFHSSYTEIADFIRYFKPKDVCANVVAIRESRDRTEAMLKGLLVLEEPEQETTSEPESWRCLTDIDVWWKGKRKCTSVINGGVAAKIANTGNTIETGSSTGSRASTPELDLWSDEETGSQPQSHEETGSQPQSTSDSTKDSNSVSNKLVSCYDSEDEESTVQGCGI